MDKLIVVLILALIYWVVTVVLAWVDTLTCGVMSVC